MAEACFAIFVSSGGEESDDDLVGDLDNRTEGPSWTKAPLTEVSNAWIKKDFRLRVRAVPNTGGNNLHSWLSNRSESPLSNYYLARCPPRAACSKCNSARKLTCEALNLAQCLACQSQNSLYCYGLDQPLFCPRWGFDGNREYINRQNFFKEKARLGAEMTPTRVVIATPPHPAVQQVTKLRKGLDRLVGRSSKIRSELADVSHTRDGNLSLAEEIQKRSQVHFGVPQAGRQFGRERPAKVSLEDEILEAEQSRNEMIQPRFCASVTDLRRQVPSAELPPGEQASLVSPTSQVSVWERGYTVEGMDAQRCPIDRNHCRSTPAQPDTPQARFNTRGEFNQEPLSSVLKKSHRVVKDVQDQGSPELKRRDEGHGRRVQPGLGLKVGDQTREEGRASLLREILEGHQPSVGLQKSSPVTNPSLHVDGAWGFHVPVGQGDREHVGQGSSLDRSQRQSRLRSKSQQQWSDDDDDNQDVRQASRGPRVPQPEKGLGGNVGGARSKKAPASWEPPTTLGEHQAVHDDRRANPSTQQAGLISGFTNWVMGNRNDGDQGNNADGHPGNGQDSDRGHAQGMGRGVSGNGGGGSDDGDNSSGRGDGGRRGGRRESGHRDPGRGGHRRRSAGQGGDGGSDDDDDDLPSSDGSFLRRRKRQDKGPTSKPQVTDALNLIVDRLEGLSVAGGAGNVSSKQKAVEIPPVGRGPDGLVTALNFFQWLGLLTRLVDDLNLNKSYVLLQICTSPKILPARWKQACLGSQTLGEALARLIDLNPPKESTFPLLVGQLTGLDPTGGSHQEVIDRAGDLLVSLSLLQSLHPMKDLTREQALACLFSLGSSLELQSGIVDAVAQMDYLRNLPIQHSDHQSYIASLIAYLERQRKIRVDVLASVECGRWTKSQDVPHLHSFVQPALGVGGRADRVVPLGGGQGRSGAAGGPKSPMRCGFGCSGHQTWNCPKTLDCRLKKISVPANVCKKCCSTIIPGTPHKANCNIFEYTNKKDSKKYRIDRICPVHQGCHALLCSACGKDPQLVKPVPVVAQRANPLRPAAPAAGKDKEAESVKVPCVVFMSETVRLVGTSGETQDAVIYYDSLSGVTFSHGVSELFNHGMAGQVSETFSLSTFIGEGSYTLPVVTLQVSSANRAGNVQSLICYVSDYPVIPACKLPPGLEDLKVGNVTPQQQESCPVKILLGAEYITLFPTAVRPPARIRETFSGLMTFRSRLTGNLLLAGKMSRTQSKFLPPSFPFMMTIPAADGESSDMGVGRGALVQMEGLCSAVEPDPQEVDGSD